MKFTPFRAAALALSLGFVGSASLHAQTVSVSGTDMILQFLSSGGQGSADVLEVDLGTWANYVPGGAYYTGSPVSLNSFLNVADLAGTGGAGSNGVTGAGYGASWDTDGDVSWGILGAQSNSTTTDGFSKDYLFAGNTAGQSAPTGLSLTQQGNVVNSTFVPYQNALANYDYTANSNAAAWLAETDPNSFYSFATSGGGAPYFGDGGLSSFLTVANGTSTADLYAVKPTNLVSGTEIGVFTLSSSGLSYVGGTAVPEPSTWASIILGAAALVGFGVRRRRA